MIINWGGAFYVKKKLFMIIIVAVICVVALSVALVMVRGERRKSQ